MVKINLEYMSPFFELHLVDRLYNGALEEPDVKIHRNIFCRACFKFITCQDKDITATGHGVNLDDFYTIECVVTTITFWSYEQMLGTYLYCACSLPECVHISTYHTSK